MNDIDFPCLGDRCIDFVCLYNHSINEFIDSFRNILVIGVFFTIRDSFSPALSTDTLLALLSTTGSSPRVS